MYLWFSNSVAKNPEEAHLCEDAYFIYPKEGKEKKICVVSDGASESFDSRLWANLLTEEFVNYFKGDIPDTSGKLHLNENIFSLENQEQKIIYAVIERAISKYETKYPKNKDWGNEWFKEKSYQKGSFATLLAAVEKEKHLELYCVGDSLALVIKNGKYVSYPYKSEKDFLAPPLPFASNREQNEPLFKQENFFQPINIEKAQEGEELFILLMTDALGAWVLVDDMELRNERIKELLNIYEDFQLEELVLRERAASAHKLKYDDSTLVVLANFPRKAKDLTKERAEYEAKKEAAKIKQQEARSNQPKESLNNSALAKMANLRPKKPKGFIDYPKPPEGSTQEGDDDPEPEESKIIKYAFVTIMTAIVIIIGYGLYFKLFSPNPINSTTNDSNNFTAEITNPNPPEEQTKLENEVKDKSETKAETKILEEAKADAEKLEEMEFIREMVKKHNLAAPDGNLKAATFTYKEKTITFQENKDNNLIVIISDKENQSTKSFTFPLQSNLNDFGISNKSTSQNNRRQ